MSWSSKLENRINGHDKLQLLEEVKSFVEKVWKEPALLVGFTDHGPNHVRRVLHRIEEILGDKLSDLSDDEVFVLLLACWLHDVAMQDYGVVAEQKKGRLWNTPLDWNELELVRKKHAPRLRVLLESDEPRIEFQGNKHIDFPKLGLFKRHVARVASGHATAEFLNVAGIPSDKGPTGLNPFRYDLLAALLLLSDECDLDYSRAIVIDNAGLKDLDPESILHLLKHRYVCESQIVPSLENPSYRQLKIRYEWPAESDDIQPLYKRWIEGKIIEQINIVHPVLQRQLGIAFDPDSPIECSNSPVTKSLEPLPEHVMPLLDAERARMDLANLETELDQLKRAIGEKKVICLEESEIGMLGARELGVILASKVLSDFKKSGVVIINLVEIDLESSSTGTDPHALACRILAVTANPEISTVDTALDDDVLSRTPHVLEFAKLAKDASETIVFICNAHELPFQSKRFLAEALIPGAYATRGKMVLIVTTKSLAQLQPEGISISHDKIHRTILPKVNRKAVVEFLKRHTVQTDKTIETIMGDAPQFTQAEARKIAIKFA